MGHWFRVLSTVCRPTKLTMCFQSIKCATDVRPPLKHAILIINKRNEKDTKFYKEGMLAGVYDGRYMFNDLGC